MADRFQDLVLIKAVDVLLLRSDRKHACSLAEDDQAVILVGFLKLAMIGTYAHGGVFSRSAYVDEEWVRHIQDRNSLQPGLCEGQGVLPVTCHCNFDGRLCDRILGITGMLQHGLRTSSARDILGKDQHDSICFLDCFCDRLRCHSSVAACFIIIVDPGLLQQHGHGTHKGLVHIRHLGHVIVGDRLCQLICFFLRLACRCTIRKFLS
mmetsp:Transcript_118012/g.280135  ORF Transcript_118012/g.280135 Transcript_118012/m.280135 type:complete len:208 (+) Transcript_118012:1451-2074(+)